MVVHTVSQRNNGEMVSLQLVLTVGEQSLRMCANDVPSITLSMLLSASCLLVWLAFGEENKLRIVICLKHFLRLDVFVL